MTNYIKKLNSENTSVLTEKSKILIVLNNTYKQYLIIILMYFLLNTL